MAHHSEYPGLDPKAAREAFERQEKIDQITKKMVERSIGATGQFPEGKLAEHDEGELAFAVGAKGGKVVIEFGKEVASVGFTPQQAIQLAQSLLDKARLVTNDVLTITI